MTSKYFLMPIFCAFIAFNSLAQKHTIGERFGGCVVFWVDSTGQHGLIASKADQSNEIKSYNGKYKRIDDGISDGVGAGAKKTAVIIGAMLQDNPKGTFAAKICADYKVTDSLGVTYSDWYLPCIDELNLLQLQKDVVGGFNDYYYGCYWSSSEQDEARAFTRFISGQSKNDDRTRGRDKMLTYHVRAIRAF